MIQSNKICMFSKTCLKRSLKNRPNEGLKDKWLLNEGRKYCRMLPLEHSAILLTCIKQLSVLKTYFGLLFEWPLKHLKSYTVASGSSAATTFGIKLHIVLQCEFRHLFFFQINILAPNLTQCFTPIMKQFESTRT